MKKGFLLRASPKRAAPPVDTSETDVRVTTEVGEAAMALGRVKLVDEHGNKKTMAAKKSSNSCELAAAALNKNDGGGAKPLTIKDLPKEILVSIFIAVGDQTGVRHTMPLVCKAWNEIYLSKDASPLHEKIEVGFSREVDVAQQERRGLPPRRPVVRASRVISWAEKRASSVRELHLLEGEARGALEDFGAKDFAALVAVAGSSWTDIGIGAGLDRLLKKPLWKSLRDSVVPAGRLRSFAIAGIESVVSDSDVAPLGRLAGSLEELVLWTEVMRHPSSFEGIAVGLPRFPESLCALEKLERLWLIGNPQLTAIPAAISSLKNLKCLNLAFCQLESLPKELGELSGLTQLNLAKNEALGDALTADEAFPAELGRLKSLRELKLAFCGLRTVPAFVGKLKSLEDLDLGGCDLSSLPKELGELLGLTKLIIRSNLDLGTTLSANEAFPAELGRLKSLRELILGWCGLRTVPAFVGGLESLEVLDLEHNRNLQIDAPLDFLIEGCPGLHDVNLQKMIGGVPWTRDSLAHLKAFKAKLRAKNPNARVIY